MRTSLGSKPSAVAAALLGAVLLAAGCGSTIRLGARVPLGSEAPAGIEVAATDAAAAAAFPTFEGPTKEVTLGDGRTVQIPVDATVDASGNIVAADGTVLAPKGTFEVAQGGGPTTTSPGDPTTIPGTATTRPAPTASTTTTTQPGVAPCPSKGEVKVGFIVLANSSDFQSTYLNGAPSVGDVPGQVTAVVDHINKNGGVGCKKLVPVFRSYDSQSASVANENTICTRFAQDDKVFAVSMQAMIHEQTRRCYQSKGILAFDDSAFGMASSVYAENPLLWNPAYPDYSRAVRGLVPSLADRRFFTGGKLGIVAFDTAAYRKVVADDLRPALAARSVPLAAGDIYYVNNSSIQSMETGFAVAITGFQSSGVNRVIFVGTTPLAPFFITTARAQSFSPRYGLTTFDNPRYMEKDASLNPLMSGSMGVGFNPSGDVDDARFAFPAPGLETTCRDIIKAGGKEPQGVNRANYRYGIAHCETLLLFAEGAKLLDGAPLTAASWTAAAEGLDASFQAASSFGTRFGRGRHDGASAARALTFQDACRCFAYTGDAPSPG